jgi:hypothetical protein
MSNIRKALAGDKKVNVIIGGWEDNGEEDDSVTLSRSAAGLFDESKETVNFGYVTLQQALQYTLEDDHRVVCTGLGI